MTLKPLTVPPTAVLINAPVVTFNCEAAAQAAVGSKIDCAGSVIYVPKTGPVIDTAAARIGHVVVERVYSTAAGDRIDSPGTAIDGTDATVETADAAV